MGAERVLLVGVRRRGETRADVDDRMEEMAALADSAGARVVDQVVQSLPVPDGRTYVGSGLLEELKALCAHLDVDALVFDAELTPSQTRNIEAAVERPAIDRSRLILDIFAQRARSREGKLQVELAQLTYLLPRLSGLGVSLSRLGGGIGTRGPGETRLEVDRRRIRRRIGELRRQISDLRKQRDVQRRGRTRQGLPLVALVGYTNAGKSTLLNSLAQADVEVADQLFATLDPTVRLAVLDGGYRILLADTVGFIRDLPPALMSAFAATLEELQYADLLLHVVDASHPRADGHREDVERILRQLGLGLKPRLLVWNKVDRLGGLPGAATGGVRVSALTGQGLDQLREAIRKALFEEVAVQVRLTYDQGKWLNHVYSVGVVHLQEHGPEGYWIHARMPRHEAQRLAQVASVQAVESAERAGT